MMEEKYIAPKDAAEILVVKKTTVYDMIKQGRLKAVKIGKQFRIRESDVLALVGDSPQDPGAAGQESLLLCGQDMLLDHLCARVNAAEGYQAVSRSYLGSYNGLFALYQGQANFATAHLWDWDTDQYNLPCVPTMLPGMEEQVYHIVNRPIGIYTAPGNPKGITCVEDFAREDVRMVNREKGSGIRVLTTACFCAPVSQLQRSTAMTASSTRIWQRLPLWPGERRTVPWATSAVCSVPGKWISYR